jgi:hypothetical protein
MKSLGENMKIIWAGRILSIIAVLPFIPSAIMKLTSNPKVIEGMAHFGIPESLILTIGILEISSVILYLIPWTSVLGAILLTGYLGGAIMTHLRLSEAVPMQIGIGILVWLGLFLQDNRLRELLPLRKKN